MSKQAATQLAKSNVVATASKNTSGLLQRQCGCGTHTIAGGECEECKKSNHTIFRKPNQQSGNNSFSNSTIALPKSSGQPLAPPLRHFMEARFKHDFSSVRVHTDSEANASAKSMGALAYTYGQDIFFDSSSFRPHTPHGLTLIAHELSHVVQQSRHPLPLNEELRIEPETSAAEVEADRMALAVVTPGPMNERSSARSRGLNRGAGWAVLGGVVGAALGAIALLAGPWGLLAVAAGAALGAWLGFSLTNDQTKDKSGTPGQRIARLLTRSGTDFRITDDEAMEALGILQELEKTDPEELFRQAMYMKNSGRWATLREELPPIQRPSFDYFDLSPLNPNRGLIMAGDEIHLEFYDPRKPRPLREPEEGKEESESGDKKDDKKKKKEKEPPSREERITRNYEVASDGIYIREIQTTLPVVGKSLKDAAQIAARAITDPLWSLEVAVKIRPVKRGGAYAAMGPVTDPETVRTESVTTETERVVRRDKYERFREHVPLSFADIGEHYRIAVDIYHREINDNLDKHNDPETLWKWAQAEAERTWEEIHKKTPRQEFREFAHQMLSSVETKPKDEQRRLYETWRRYSVWVDRQSDEKLARRNPVEIWVQAYVNIIDEETHKASIQRMEELREKRRQEAYKKAEQKLQQTIDFSIARIRTPQPTRSASAGEHISETTGEAVEIGYLIQASTAEKIIRDKIGSDFLHYQIERLRNDPEAFNKTSVKDDFVLYLNKNPEQLKALHLTMSRPEVERQEHRIDVPAWQTASEIAVGFIPFVGSGVAIVEVVGGRDLFGHPLTTTERVIIGVAILLPGIAKVAKGGKDAFKASRVVKEFGLTGAEADRVYKIYLGLGPGTPGAKLFQWGANEIKKGRAIDDPKVLKEMETVLKDLGMTEKETAKALRPAALQQQVETVAKEEVQALKAMTGSMSDDTEKMLLKNDSLRQALKENTLAAKVLKKCNTPCWPEEATAQQVQELQHLIERLKKVNAFDEEKMRRFLFRSRKNLGAAIEAISHKTIAAEVAHAAKTAKAAEKAAAKQAKQEAKIMDVAERNKAAAELERAEKQIKERIQNIASATQDERIAREQLAALHKQEKVVPSSLEKDMARIDRLKNVEDKLEALENVKPGATLSQAEKEFLEWRRKTWELQQEVESAEEAAKTLSEGLPTLTTRKEVAAEALREASKDVMAVFREEGPRYRSKSSINIDQVMMKEAWEALTTKPALATDHLVSLERISKLKELNEILILYTKASKSVKAEIKEGLKAIGDIDKNLVRMRADVNSGIKGKKSWYDITYAQVEGKYTVAEVDAIRVREDEAMAEILSEIDKLTNKFRAKVTAKPAKAAAAGAK